jgi:hypothetical protein
MLELRPSCENCAKLLPADSEEARICSYECTFCAGCVNDILHNVCPNCGGGFVSRPIRPAQNRKGCNFLGAHPATTKVTSKPVDLRTFSELCGALREIPPSKR